MTSKKLPNPIEIPFNQMLTALADVPGYDEYVQWLLPRISKARGDLSWKAEIKSLFEVNKVNHPLLRITSHEDHVPEGIFHISGELGILEAAYIEWLFDANEKTRTCINKCTNLFDNVKKIITNNNWLVLIIDSVDTPPSLEDTAFLKRYLTNNEPDNSWKKTSYGRYGYFDSQLYDLENLIPENGLGFMGNNRGSAPLGYPVDLIKKVIQVLKAKREQHKERYPNHIKVYYMLVNSPPTVIERITENERLKIQRQIKEDEIVVISAFADMTDRYWHVMHQIVRREFNLDLSNRFLETKKVVL